MDINSGTIERTSTDLTSGSCATCELESCFRARDQEVECAFFDGSIFYSCRSSHLEITSLIVIDPLSPGELDGAALIPTQTP